MEDQRKFVRYRVANLLSLKAQMDNNRRNEKLIMFGEGGCGFYGIAGKLELSLPKRVFSVFLMDELEAKVQGNLLYSRNIMTEGGEVTFYGIEFIPSHRALVRPIVERLQKLAESGEISIEQIQRVNSEIRV